MDRSAALLERAQKVGAGNAEIDQIIEQIQRLSLGDSLQPPTRALPWWVAPALAVAFAAGVATACFF